MKKWLTVGAAVSICAVTLAGAAACALYEEPKTYTVTFLNEGALYKKYDGAKIGDAFVFPEDPSHSVSTEYTFEFLGWKYQGEEDTHLVDTQTAKVAGDTTFESVYAKTPVQEEPPVNDLFTVEFYDMSFQEGVSRGTLIKRYTDVKYGSGVEAPEAPTHDGYHFVGWNVNSFDHVYGNMYVTAKYEKNVYTLEKHVLGEMRSAEIEYAAPLDLTAPEAVGMLGFDGWYLDEECTTPVEKNATMPAIEAFRDAEDIPYTIDGEGRLHIYAKHEIDLDGLALSAADEMVYGGNNTVTLMGAHFSQDFALTYAWQVDGETTNDVGTQLTLVDAGEHDVTLSVTANYKNGTLIQSKELEGTYHVAKAALTATVLLEKDSVAYGEEAVPSVTFEGVVQEDDLSGYALTYSYKKEGAFVEGRLHAGEYSVSAAFTAEPRNYTIGEVKEAALTVTPKEVTVTARAADLVYGEKPAPMLECEGLIDGDTVDLFTAKTGEKFLYQRGGEAYEEEYFAAGGYTVRAGELAAADYAVTSGEATPFTVEKAPLTLTPTQERLTYGQQPTPDYEGEGFVLNETKAVLTGTPQYSYFAEGETAEGNHLAAGEYTLGLSGLTSENYEIAFAEGSFTVEKAALNLSAELTGTELTYGNPTSTLYTGTGIKYEGLQYEDRESTIFAGNAPALGFYEAGEEGEKIEGLLHVGTYVAKLSDADMDAANELLKNYTIVSFTEKEFTVKPRPVTLTLQLNGYAPQKSYTYGDLEGAQFNMTYSDGANALLEDDIEAFGFAVEATRDGEAYTFDRQEQGDYVPFGQYAAELKFEANQDYTLSCEKAEFEIAKQDFTINWKANGGIHAEYRFEPTFGADSPFTFEGALKLNKNGDTTSYTNADIGTHIVWENAAEGKDYRILANGIDVTENFNVTFGTVAITLINSQFNFTIEDVAKTFDGTTVIPNPVKELQDAEQGTVDRFKPVVEYRYNTETWQEEYIFDSILDAGEYTIQYRVRVPDDKQEFEENYGTVEGTFKITIGKAAYRVTTPEENTFTYNKGAQGKELTVEGVAGDKNFPQDVAVTYTVNEVSGHQQTAAGTYTVSYAIAASKNYQEAAGSYQLVIEKATVEKPTADGNTFTYNGNEQTYTLAQNENYKIEGNTQTNAGTHTVTVTLLDEANYKWADTAEQESEPLTFDFTIAKAKAVIAADDGPTNAIYDREAQYTLNASTNFGEIEYAYEFRGEAVEDRPNFIDAGKYKIVLTVAGTDNWDGDAKTIEFEIAKAELETLPEGVEAPAAEETVVRKKGQNLESLALLGKDWTWKAETDTTSDLILESYSFTAVYTDPNGNYEPYESTVAFKTVKEQIEITEVGMIEADYNADGGVENAFLKALKEEKITAGRALSVEELALITAKISGIADYSVGGTFLATVTFETNNDYFDLTGASEFEVVAKIKSVDVGGTLYTIEDAFKTAQEGTITVKTNTSFATAEVAEKAGYTAEEGYYTVKESVTLFLPYDTSKNAERGVGTGTGTSEKVAGFNGTTQTDKYGAARGKSELCDLTLTVPEGLALTNNGTIDIGGITSGGGGNSDPNTIGRAGQTSSGYARLVLGKNVTLTSTGSITALGFIEESALDNGSQILLNGGSLTMPFVVREHRGGGAFCTMVGGALAAMGKDPASNLQTSPFNRFYMENVHPKLIVLSTAKVYGKADLYANNVDNQTDICMIGGTSESLIRLSEEAKAIAKFNTETAVTDLEIKGDMTLNALSLKLELGEKFGIKLNPTLHTKAVFFPLTWYYRVVLSPFENGNAATVNATAQKLKIMPGASLTVAKDVTLQASEIVVYEKEAIQDIKDSSGEYEKKDEPSVLIVNGTMTANKLAGYVQTKEDGAKITISDSTTIDTKEVSSHSGSGLSATVNYKSISTTLTGEVYNSDTGLSTKEALGVGTWTSKEGAWATDTSTLN